MRLSCLRGVRPGSVIRRRGSTGAALHELTMRLAGGVLLVPVLFEEACAIRLADLRGGGGDHGDLGTKAPVWRPCTTSS